MALPNLTGKIISLGYNLQVRAGDSSSSASVIGFASEASYTENFQHDSAKVIGHFGPISIDPQDYECTIAIKTFVPAKVLIEGDPQYPDGGDKSIFDFIDSRESIATNGSFTKITYLDFYDKVNQKVIASFNGVIINSDGMQVNNGYTRADVSMVALERNKWT